MYYWQIITTPNTISQALLISANILGLRVTVCKLLRLLKATSVVAAVLFIIHQYNSRAVLLETANLDLHAHVLMPSKYGVVVEWL